MKDGLKIEEWKIKLTNNVPVAKTYNALPCPLYEDVKIHLKDLLRKEFS